MTEYAATELRSADPRSEVWFDRDAGIDVGAAVLWPAAYRLVVDDDVTHAHGMPVPQRYPFDDGTEATN